MFTVEQRDAARDAILELARGDPRIVAAAFVGASAAGGDRWSDLDLTFGVADGASVAAVLEEWTSGLESELDAVRLFDLPRDTSIYRVFLFPGCLQVDVSFTPASSFGARGPRFELLFGEAIEHPPVEPPSADELFGLAAHHAVRTRFCIERARLWQAEYWLSALRDHVLELACLARGLETSYGRGFDRLPAEVTTELEGALVASLDAKALLGALGVAVDGLLREGAGLPAADRVAARLRELF